MWRGFISWKLWHERHRTRKLTTKDTKNTKLGVLIIQILRTFVLSFENNVAIKVRLPHCRHTRESGYPGQSFHRWIPACAGIGECKLMNHFVVSKTR